ncbi:hypothetical protein SLE2022_217100 [Rubroshorea leprosula]
MDKSRDMRRGASRFSRQINKQSGHKLLAGLDGIAGNFVSLEKSKKEKVRKLSAVNGRGSPSKEESEMGCSDLSDRENECPSHSQSIVNNVTSKRFKISKKFFDDCNVVDHASVPRKLRSAMKKRNRESVSPPLPDTKRLNHTLGGESPQKDGINKPKLNSKERDSEWSTKLSVSGPITKDEEEVVETLYALAGMFPDNDTIDKNKLDNESLEEKPSAPPETVESPCTSTEVKKEASSACPPEAVKAVLSVNLEVSPNEAVKINSLNGTNTEEQHDLPDSKTFHMEPNSSIPQASLNASMSSLSRTESSDRKPPSTPGSFHGLPELGLETGFKLPKQQVITPTERKPEIAFKATSIEVQLGQEYVIKETRKNGVALWPGLSSTVPLCAGSHGPSQSSTAKLPAWLDAAMCSSRPSSSQNGTSARKVSEVTTYRKPMRRCAAHVYISRLIQSLQMSESKDSVECIELKHQEGLKQAVVMPPNDLNSVRNGINGTLSCISLSTNRNTYEAGSSSYLQYKKFHQDQLQMVQASGMHTSLKQYDFLSLLAGGGGEDINSRSNKAGNAFETLSQQKVPYLHLLPQHESLAAFSLPQAHSTSSTYSDQLSVAAASIQQGPLQLPPYLSSPFFGPSYTSHPDMGKQQVQLQQRLLAAQFAAHCRGSGTSTALTQFPSWKNGKNVSPAPIAGVQTIIPSSPLSLDALGPKYATVPQHQQPLMPISSSLPPTKVKRQDHHLPLIYEESGAGFRAGGALPMQLLCNERL